MESGAFRGSSRDTGFLLTTACSLPTYTPAAFFMRDRVKQFACSTRYITISKVMYLSFLTF